MESKYMIYWCHFVVSYENWTEKQFIIYSPDTQRATPALESDNRTLRSFYSVALQTSPNPSSSYEQCRCRGRGWDSEKASEICR